MRSIHNQCARLYLEMLIIYIISIAVLIPRIKFILFNNHVFLLPGQMFVLHLTEWNALQGLFQQLVGLHVDPLGH